MPDNDKQKRQKGIRASQVYNDPLVQEALRGMEDTLFYNFKTSKYKDLDDREEIYKQLQAIRGFKDQFEKWIRDGEGARIALDQQLEAVV